MIQEVKHPSENHYGIIAVYKGQRLINIDSQVPNKVFCEWLSESLLFQDINLIKAEYRYGSSRLDFYMASESRKVLVEVKGLLWKKRGSLVS